VEYVDLIEEPTSSDVIDLVFHQNSDVRRRHIHAPYAGWTGGIADLHRDLPRQTVVLTTTVWSAAVAFAFQGNRCVDASSVFSAPVG
jgi:hypothetical protein